MAEVESSDGNQYTIPDFALEDTQEKMLAILKKQFKLNDKELKNAQAALKNDDKNTKAQLDAFKKLGGDIKGALDGKGSLLGNIGKGAGVTTNALMSLGGGLTKFGAVVTGVTTGLAALALNVTKGFGEDLRASGLVETGAAFGDLGSQLNTLVPQIQSMGMSLDTTLGVIQDFRQTLTVVGTEASKGLVKEFNRLTASGSLYGRTLSENVEYLADEIDFRQRLMFMGQQDAALNARLTQEVLDSQVEAAQLLGKSVKDIADSTKAMILGNKSLQSVLSSMPAEALTEIQKSLNTFSGIELPESFQASLMQAIADPVFLMSDEAKDLFNNIGMVNNEQSKILQKEMADMQAAVQSRDTKAIAAANKEFEKAVVNFAGSIKGEDQARLQLFADSGFTYIQDLLINQQLAAEGMKRFVDGVMVSVSNEARLSAMFDTQIEAIQAAFGSVNTAIRSGFAPALENLTGILGKASDPESPLGAFNTRIGEIATSLTERLQAILGVNDTNEAQKAKEVANQKLIEVANAEYKTAEERDAALKAAKDNLKKATESYNKAIEEDQGIATKGLTMIGNLIEMFADKLVDLVAAFDSTDGNFMERIGKFVGIMFEDLVGIIGEQVRQIDIMDVLFGESEKEITDNAKKRVEAANKRRRGNQTEEQKSEGLMRALSDVIDYRDAKNEKKPGSVDAEKMLEMINKAGVKASDLTGKDLLTLFPDPNDLQQALLAKYEETDAKLMFSSLSQKMIDATDARIEELDGLEMKAWHGADGAKELQNEQKALAAGFKDARMAMLQEVEVTAKKRSEKIEETKTPQEKQQEEILANVNKETGTPPTQQSKASIIKDPETAEPTTPSPTSQDGSDTQSVKPTETKMSENNQDKTDRLIELASNQITKTEELTRVLKQVVTNTGATASNTG